MQETTLPIVQLDAVDSTNNYAAKLIEGGNARHGTAIMAQFQTEGRGQRGSVWASEAGRNLLASVILLPKSLELKDSFLINKLAGVAVVEYLEDLGIEGAGLKWPNDILVSDKKICGILSETRTDGKKIKAAIVGIGLNVSQVYFGDELKATSIILEEGTNANLTEHLREIQKGMVNWLSIVERKGREPLDKRYYKFLNGYRSPILTRTSDGMSRMAYIRQVDDDGKLNLEFENGDTHSFALHEIKILI